MKIIIWPKQAGLKQLKQHQVKFLLTFLLIAPLAVSAQLNFYVDPVYGSDQNRGNSISAPFKTIKRARNAVRRFNKSMVGDITVNLRGGTYFLDSTLLLTSRDAGTNGHYIIYTAYNCEQPVISGGLRINNWALHDAAKNIYVASVGTAVDSRQLFVNGRRATRARSDNASGWTEDEQGYVCPPEVNNWKNITNVEVVSLMVWKCHRGPIASVSDSHVQMAQPFWQYVHMQFGANPSWIENAYELLDEEGEWYLDKSAGMVYYKPRTGESMDTSEVIMPLREVLLQANGAQNVEFRRVSFEHATWLAPNGPKGHPVHQADERLTSTDWKGFEQIPGNVILDHCNGLKFNSCTFRRLGSTALQLWKGCVNNQIYNCTFTDVSGSGISVGPLSDSFPQPDDILKDNVISNNLIHRIAVEYKSCVGIIVGYTDHTVISHNEIRNLPYTGISVGWGWTNTITSARNNEISYNRIDSVVTELDDGGAIYILSAQAGTQVHHNYVTNQLHEYSALYLDQGTSDIKCYQNFLDKVYMWTTLTFPECLRDTVENNYYTNDLFYWGGTNCILRDNVQVLPNFLPEAARKIVKNAGRFRVFDCSNDGIDKMRGEMKLFPNPTPDRLNISFQTPFVDNYVIEIYNAEGRLLDRIRKSPAETLTGVNLGRFPTGLYFIRVTSGKTSLSGKVIKR